MLSLAQLNERLFDDGSARVRVPLLSAVAASNEGPESDELAALHDRFLLRKLVSPVSDDGILSLLLGKDEEGGEAEGENENEDECTADAAAAELRQALSYVRKAAPSVSLPRWTALLLRDARSYVRELSASEGVGGGYVSDRRLRRASELLKASAAAHGRQAVSVVDAVAVLPHVLWEESEEAQPLAEWIEENALPEGGEEQISFLLASVRARAEAAAEARAEGGGEGGGGEGGAGDFDALVADADALAVAAVDAAAEMRIHLATLQSAREHLFLPPDAAAACMQALVPVARDRLEALQRLAAGAVALQMAILEGLDPTGGGNASTTFEQLLEGIGEAGGSGGGGDGREEGGGAEPGGGSGKEDGFSFSEEELAWGRKEAKAKLGPEEFKAWRKAAKKAAKSAN